MENKYLATHLIKVTITDLKRKHRWYCDVQKPLLTFFKSVQALFS